MALATLTCQYVVTQAIAMSAGNKPPISGNTPEMLSRIRAQQRVVFTHCATRSREFLVTGVNLTSSPGTSGRILDLSTVSPPVERVLQLSTAAGITINQVDPLDMAGELAPRYYPVGLTLNEVNAEWGAAGTVAFQLLYVYAPLDINPTGSLAQPLTLPDQWVDILVGDLGAYFAHKDLARDPTGQETATCRALADSRMLELDAFLDSIAGARAWRTDVPRPNPVPQ